MSVMSYLFALQGTAPMHVGGNKNAKNREIGADGMRNWSFGLFSCFVDCGFCTYENRPPIRVEPLSIY